MSRDSERTSFSVREIQYLESLPAVEHVTKDRIRYTPEFRHECMRLYAQGESPVRIFRSAGLDPSLIGYKRIERCIARWKTGGDDGKQPAAGLGASQSDADSSANTTSDVSALQVSTPKYASPLTVMKRPRFKFSKSSAPRFGEDIFGHGGLLSDSPVLSVASPDRGSHDNNDIFTLIIMQQARRIETLEHELQEVRTELQKMSNPRRSA